MIDKTTPSLHTLPVELCYRILDHLDDWTIGTTAHNVCQRLNHIIDTYDRYKIFKITTIDGLISDNQDQILEALRQYQQIIQQYIEEKNILIDEIITIYIVRRFIELSIFAQDLIQLHATRILVNLTSTDSSSQIKDVINADGIPNLIKTLNSSNQNIQNQAIQSLANIARGNSEYYDFIINKGTSPSLLDDIHSSDSQAALVVLDRLLYTSESEVLANTCSAISHLTRYSNEAIQTVIELGVLPRLVTLVKNSPENIQLVALCTIENIVRGDDQQIQTVLDADTLQHLLTILNSPSESHKRDICWIMLNISAINESQNQAVFDANIIPSLIDNLRHDDYKIRKEAAWAVIIAMQNTPKLTKYVINQGVIPPLCEMLNVSSTTIIGLVLNGLEIILKLGMTERDGTNFPNPYARMIEECYGLDKIESLQAHGSITVYKKAFRIVDTYFCLDDDDEDENISQQETKHHLTSDLV